MTATDLFCDDPEREPLLRASDLDGIDAVEVPFDDQTRLRVSAKWANGMPTMV